MIRMSQKLAEFIGLNFKGTDLQRSNFPAREKCLLNSKRCRWAFKVSQINNTKKYVITKNTIQEDDVILTARLFMDLCSIWSVYLIRLAILSCHISLWYNASNLFKIITQIPVFQKLTNSGLMASSTNKIVALWWVKYSCGSGNTIASA